MPTYIKLTKCLFVFLAAFTLLLVSTFLDLGQGVAHAGRVTKAKNKAISKVTKLPRHDSSIVSQGSIILISPSLNWKTGEVDSVQYEEGVIDSCDNTLCYREISSRREYFDGRPIRHYHSLEPEATSEVINLIYKNKHYVGFEFADPPYGKFTNDLRSDFTYINKKGSHFTVGIWYQTDTQKTKALKRWEKMHKIMARYSSNAKASRRAKLGEILGIVGKAVDAFN